MRQTLTYNPLQFVQLGAAYGYSRAKGEQASQTVSDAPVVEAASRHTVEELFGRYDKNPRWADFPRWLEEYRSQMNVDERELVHQD